MPLKQSPLLLAFLINPFSGGGVGKRVFHQLPEIMASFGMDSSEWTAELTEENRLEEQTDAFLLAAQKVIAVGGDGTIGFVLNRLRKQHLPHTQIGLIPLGTGNDLGRTLGIYNIYSQRGLLASVKRLLRAQSTKFDLWEINRDKTLASYLSLGLDASVLYDFDTARKAGRIPKGAWFNRLYYVRSFIKHSTYRIREPIELELEFAGEKKTISLKNKVCCLVANINSYAAGAHPFLTNPFDDGKLEVIVFDNIWKFAALTIGSRIYPRFAKFLHKHLPTYNATSVHIKGANATPCQLDGEDLSEYCRQQNALSIHAAQSVQLLDLRSANFSLF